MTFWGKTALVKLMLAYYSAVVYKFKLYYSKQYCMWNSNMHMKLYTIKNMEKSGFPFWAA